MIFDLPTALEFGGREWDIDPDFRQVLRILSAFEDPDLTDGEKAMLCLMNLYVDVEEIPEDQLQAALDAAIAFIDQKAALPEAKLSQPGAGMATSQSGGLGRATGVEKGNKEESRAHRFPHRARDGPRTMDWTQDAPLIFPAVNRVAGFEVRSVEFMHWWTFMGLFMEIRDSVYSTVLSLRGKRARGKKLEKNEQEFWNNNLAICRLKPRLSAEEREEREALERLLVAGDLLPPPTVPRPNPQDCDVGSPALQAGSTNPPGLSP